MDTKTCGNCCETKALTEFNRKRDGVASWCKLCTKAYAAAWRAANTDKIKAWRAANSDRIRALARTWRAANPDKVRTYQATWQRANPKSTAARDAERCAKLVPSYVAKKLGVPTKDLTPELLELKRQQIELHRLQRQLQATLKDLNHDRRDAEPADQRDLPDLSDLDNG